MEQQPPIGKILGLFISFALAFSRDLKQVDVAVIQVVIACADDELVKQLELWISRLQFGELSLQLLENIVLGRNLLLTVESAKQNSGTELNTRQALQLIIHRLELMVLCYWFSLPVISL